MSDCGSAKGDVLSRKTGVSSCLSEVEGVFPIAFWIPFFPVFLTGTDVHESVRGRWEINTQILLINLTKFYGVHTTCQCVRLGTQG